MHCVIAIVLPANEVALRADPEPGTPVASAVASNVVLVPNIQKARLPSKVGLLTMLAPRRGDATAMRAKNIIDGPCFITTTRESHSTAARKLVSSPRHEGMLRRVDGTSPICLNEIF